MKTKREWAPGPGVEVTRVEQVEGGWVVSAAINDGGCCPACDTRSDRRHRWYIRRLHDLPAQGATRLVLRLKLTRWRCSNPECARQTFGGRRPEVVQPYGRRTRRVVDLARLVTHTAGGRPAGRLMTRLGLPRSKDTLLRSLKRGARDRASIAPVVGIDDWINRLKTLKRAMYGRAGVALLRARMLPFPAAVVHTD